MKKIHRFITEYKIKNKEIIISDKELIHQWKNVLKFKIGENIILANNGKELLTRIEKISKNDFVLSVISESINKKEPAKKVNLYLAILKKENFELAIQKATEVGIYSITPIITERTIKNGLNLERLRKIVKEASELSGRSIVPKINNQIKFEDMFKVLSSQKTILFDISGERFRSLGEKEISIIIGPEGGFTDKEISLVKEKGIEIASMSNLTLRGETASTIASYLAIN